MADTELKEKYALLERENSDIKQRLASIEADKVRVERYEKLASLKERGGFTFDVNKEVERCKHMTAEQFDEHRKVIIENYARIPTAKAVPELFVENNIAEPPQTFTEADRDGVVKYCRQHNCDWDTGYTEYMKQRAPAIPGASKVA